MREILFRGKSKPWGCWCEGFLVKERDHFRISRKDDLDAFSFVVDPETVGQFTGLTDKNGKKIFESDVIRMNGNDFDLAVVEFGEFACVSIENEERVDMVYGWHYRLIPTDALSRCEPFCWEFQLNKMWVENICIEVIGNIYDNPELLEVHDV